MKGNQAFSSSTTDDASVLSEEFHLLVEHGETSRVAEENDYIGVDDIQLVEKMLSAV